MQNLPEQKHTKLLPETKQKLPMYFYLRETLKICLLIFALFLAYIYIWQPQLWNKFLFGCMQLPKDEFDKGFAIIELIDPGQVFRRFIGFLLSIFLGSLFGGYFVFRNR